MWKGGFLTVSRIIRREGVPIFVATSFKITVLYSTIKFFLPNIFITFPNTVMFETALIMRGNQVFFVSNTQYEHSARKQYLNPIKEIGRRI